MDSFEWNKVFGGVLAAVLFIVSLNLVVEGVMTPEKSDKVGMAVAVAEEPGHDGGASGPAAPEGPPDWGTVLPAADVAAGEIVHKKCLTCHDFTNGGPNKIGPNLWGVVGNKHAHRPDYTYSAAMSGVQGNWDYDALNAFLTNPKAAVPGTKMAFAGISRTQDRVNLIAWLRAQSDAPAAIPAPKPAAAPAEAPAAPAAPAGDGEGPASQTQNPPAGETPQPVPGAAPATTTPAPAAAPAAPPATPPAH